MKPQNITGSIASKTKLMLNSFSGTIPDPNKTRAQLGDRDISLQNVREDPHVSSCIQSRKAGVLSLEYEIQFDETNSQYQDLFESVLERLNIPDLITDFLETPLYGFQVLEINWVYEYWNGRQVLVPNSVKSKPREWFSFDSAGLLKLNDMKGTVLPKYKFILLQNNPTYLNPYGDALLSKCLWPVAFKKSSMMFWILLAEVHGIPKFVGKTSNFRDHPDFDVFYDELSALIQDGVIVIPNDETVEGINPASSVNSDIYDKLIERNNSEISKVLLSQTLTTELGSNGSYAASETHFNVRRELINQDKRLCESGIKDIFKWIRNFNFPEINIPKFIMYEQTDVDKPLAEVVGILTSGNSGFKPTKEFYMNRFGFAESEFEITANQFPSPFSQQSKEPSEPTLMSDEHNHSHEEFAESTDWDQIIIDVFADRSVREDADIMQSQIDSIKNFIDSHNNLDGAISNIADLFPDLDSAALEKKLTNLLFIADVIGRLSVQKENEDAAKK